jgi:hypothetical protein
MDGLADILNKRKSASYLVGDEVTASNNHISLSQSSRDVGLMQLGQPLAFHVQDNFGSRTYCLDNGYELREIHHMSNVNLLKPDG